MCSATAVRLGANVMVRIWWLGLGVGTALLQEVLAWASRLQLRCLELSVRTDNLAAIGLYTKIGFVAEGILRKSLYVAGDYVDEYMMAKYLE